MSLQLGYARADRESHSEARRGSVAARKEADLTGAVIFFVAENARAYQRASEYYDLFRWTMVVQALGGIWLFMAILLRSGVVFAILSNVAQFGFVMTAHTIKPTFSKIKSPPIRFPLKGPCIRKRLLFI